MAQAYPPYAGFRVLSTTGPNFLLGRSWLLTLNASVAARFGRWCSNAGWWARTGARCRRRACCLLGPGSDKRRAAQPIGGGKGQYGLEIRGALEETAAPLHFHHPVGLTLPYIEAHHIRLQSLLPAGEIETLDKGGGVYPLGVDGDSAMFATTLEFCKSLPISTSWAVL